MYYILPWGGFHAVVEILLRAGVDINAKDHEGW
jgi:hypothetical protein